MTVLDQVIETQNFILEELSKAQTRVVDTNRRLLEGAAKVLPKVELPSFETPELPKGEDVVANSFGFASQLLSTQQSFVEQLMTSWATPQAETASTKARAKTVK